MENDFAGNWNIKDHLNNLPYSERVNINALSNIFSSTAASYKYLLFLSLLDVLEDTGFDKLHIDLNDILLEMLANAWFPHNYFKLNFGVNDRIARELDRLIEPQDEVKLLNTAQSKKRVIELLKSKDYGKNNLLDLVPYRLLSPFFPGVFKNVKDTHKNKAIRDLARNRFKEAKPFYIFSEDEKSIIMNPEWILYFVENIVQVRSFINWNWLDYMQRRNPSVPNLQQKLFPPSVRSSLISQTNYWKTVLEQRQLKCIFSQAPITVEDLSLDHFLPWSFVAHDQLWNLIPVSKSINSSKSNNLPSLNKYFDSFVDLQYSGLVAYYEKPGKVSWNRIIEPYISDLRITSEDILNRNRFGKVMTGSIKPLYQMAETQGFSPGWVYG